MDTAVDHEGRSFLRCFRDGSSDSRDVEDVSDAGGEDLQGLQMLDQRIEPRVLRHDMKEGARIGCRQPPNVEGYVEIERVRPGAADLHVLGTRSESLHGGCEFERQAGLRGANEDRDPEMVGVKRRQLLRLDAFVIDEDVVGAHGRGDGKLAAEGWTRDRSESL